jgi:selenophosphate synthase
MNDFKRDDLIDDAKKYCRDSCIFLSSINKPKACERCPLKGFLVEATIVSTRQAYAIAGEKCIIDYLV